MNQQHEHYDLEQVAAAADEALEYVAGKVETPGHIGVQARFAMAGMKSLQIAIVAEVNRGTPAKDVLQAVANLFANMSLTAIESMPQDLSVPADPSGRMLVLLDHFHFAVAAIASGSTAARGKTVLVQPAPSGRA